VAERDLGSFAINDLRRGQDLQLEELPPACLVESGGGGLLFHLSGLIVEREEDTERRAPRSIMPLSWRPLRIPRPWLNRMRGRSAGAAKP
jgi:hypothetical protein